MKQLVFKQYKTIRNRKILKTLKNHREKMSVQVNVRMSQIRCMLIEVGVRTYVRNIRQLSNPDGSGIASDQINFSENLKPVASN